MCQSLKADGLDDSEVSMLAGVLREKQTFFLSQNCVSQDIALLKKIMRKKINKCVHTFCHHYALANINKKSSF